ncbi:mechanosensitive ion channel family protein [Flavobacterium branchiophilum]|uniref:Mechanosensitive ion channel protein n=1 Tax=Flavobacterium branchiophilum TaxID=55197 RepID=A0A2H3KDA2_9FLAO|nr:mechanosensitive ion channel domain-containing protein [Flavobacterium branchiophilum]PDS25576.1 mechanosensitive ion channel protein [Flavobacterium branchiophilum]
MEKIDLLSTKLYEKLIEFAPNLIAAIAILFIGIYSIRFINKIVRKIMIKREFEPTLSNFLANILFWTLRILLFVTVITQLGVGTSSFVAILGAAGLAIGLSLQGSLSNFSGGILIILFKPFKVNDLIEAQGVVGTVSEIQIFVTKLITPNNQVVFVPNGNLSNGVITNYSMLGYRRADLTLAISYQTNIKVVKNLIEEVMKNNAKILQNPEPIVVVKQLTDNAIQLSIKPCATIDNFNAVCAETLENSKTALDQAGIQIQPFVVSSSKN